MHSTFRAIILFGVGYYKIYEGIYDDNRRRIGISLICGGIKLGFVAKAVSFPCSKGAKSVGVRNLNSKLLLFVLSVSRLRLMN